MMMEEMVIMLTIIHESPLKKEGRNKHKKCPSQSMVTQMDDNDNADNEYNGNNDKDTNDHS